MLATERPQFEVLVAALLGGFDRNATPAKIEAYWLGCHRMQLGTFERAVERALSEHGPDELPTPKRMWFIAHEMRVSPTKAAEGEQQQPKTGAELVERFAASVLVSLLLGAGIGKNGEWTRIAKHGRPASEAGLAAMQKAKRDIVASAITDPNITGFFEAPIDKRTHVQLEAIADFRDVLQAALEKAWEPRSAEESAADIEHFARTGHVRDSSLLI